MQEQANGTAANRRQKQEDHKWKAAWVHSEPWASLDYRRPCQEGRERTGKLKEEKGKRERK